MSKIEQQEFDLAQFRQDLQELAQAYIHAQQSGDTQEKEVTFEAILRLGSEALAQTQNDEEAKTAIKNAVMELKVTPDPLFLYTRILLYDITGNTMLPGDQKLDTGFDTTDPLTIDTLLSTIRLSALAGSTEVIGEDHPYLREATRNEFDALAEKVASLTQYQAARALEMIREYLSRLESPLTEGPSALRKPGIRSFLIIYRAVRERWCRKNPDKHPNF